MGEVVKMAVNGGDLDHRPALWHLQRAERSAYELGATLSTEAVAALQLLRGDLRITHYSSPPDGILLCIPECETDEDFEDQFALVMFVMETMRKRARRRADNRANIIGFEWPAA